MRMIRSLISNRPNLLARTLIAACLAPLALSACGDEEGGFRLRLVRGACLIQENGSLRPHDSTVDYFPQTGSVEVTVTGDSMSPIVARAPVSNNGLDLPEIPAGKNRVATVKVWTNGEVSSVGRSMPFDVVKGESADVSVLMRRSNELTPAADKMNRCVSMEEARVAHTAVKMKDGRVLIVGGHTGNVTPSGTGSEYLATAEIFDPVSDSFYPVAPPCDGATCFQASHAPGVALPDGRVLIAGGSAPQAIDTAAIYDPTVDRWTIRHMTTPRRGHTASLLGARVIIVGGLNAEGKILDSIEFFDPRDNSFKEADLKLKNAGGNPGRAFHSAVSRDNNTLLVAGGIDGNMAVVPDVAVFLSNQNVVTVGSILGDNQLFEPVAKAGATLINRKLVVVGGAGRINKEYEAGNLSRLVQWLDHAQKGKKSTNTHDVTTLGSVDNCVVSFDGDRALVLGGLNQSGTGLSNVHTLAWNPDKGGHVQVMQVLPKTPPAGQVTCTDLGDGRILITGGVKGKEATNRADIFTIQPLK